MFNFCKLECPNKNAMTDQISRKRLRTSTDNTGDMNADITRDTTTTELLMQQLQRRNEEIKMRDKRITSLLGKIEKLKRNPLASSKQCRVPYHECQSRPLKSRHRKNIRGDLKKFNTHLNKRYGNFNAY